MNNTNNTIMGVTGGGMSRGGGGRNRGVNDQGKIYASQQWQRRRDSQKSANTINNTTNLMMLGSIDQADQPEIPDHLDHAEPAATEHNFHSVASVKRGPGCLTNKLMDKTIQSAITPMSTQNYANDNNAANEDCIKQAESLL